jgi:hypothetical protein
VYSAGHFHSAYRKYVQQMAFHSLLRKSTALISSAVSIGCLSI